MGKKVASFIPYYYSPHLETDLEIIHNHVSQGDDFTVYICSGELPACDANMDHSYDVCRHCITRRRNGLNLVGLTDKVHLRNFVNLKPADLELLNSYKDRKVKTIDELISLRLDNCFIGRTVYNEMVSLKNDTQPDFEEMAQYISNSLHSYALIYLSFKNTFAETRPDMFYTFNGRFVVSAPAIAAARAIGINFAVHDRCSMMNRYLLVHNESLHSRKFWNTQLALAWENSQHSLVEREAMAVAWFEARLRNEKQGWFSFTADQSQDLPDSFDPNKTNIVIFNSSEWEFCGMDDHELPFYKDQNDGLLRLAQDLQNQTQLQIYLRVHPHLKDKQNAQTTFISEILDNKFPNFEVIPAEAPVKTYNLMRHADAVITFGSTAGIEAAYQRVPSILIGPSPYDTLSSCITVSSHEELVDLLIGNKFKLSPEELDRRRSESYKHAYFQQVVGNAFKLFQQVDIFDIRLEGKKIGDTAPSYELGLKRELASRAELVGPTPNALAGVVRELERTADKILSENNTLKVQLKNAILDLEKARGELDSVKVKDIDTTGEARHQGQTRETEQLRTSVTAVNPGSDDKNASSTSFGYLKRFQSLLKF